MSRSICRLASLALALAATACAGSRPAASSTASDAPATTPAQDPKQQAAPHGEHHDQKHGGHASHHPHGGDAHAGHHPHGSDTHAGHHPQGSDAHAPDGHHAPFAGPPTHRFENAEHWAKVFDDPARDEWQRPDAVIDYLALKPDHRVADLGAGTGYFSVRLARKVPKGKVFAIDIEPNLIKHIEKRAKHEGLANLVAKLGNPDDPGLDQAVDVVLIVDTYHHIAQRPEYFAKLLPKLRKDGRVVIVDFKKGKLPVGPPDPHKMAPQKVKLEMKKAGYDYCGSFDELPYQYVLSFGADC